MPSGVTSVISERVGLKLTLIDRSSASATAIATPISASSPSRCEMTPMYGSARIISAARMPPMMMNGRRRPPQNHTRSLITPTSSWPMMPASGPAAHTSPISWMSRPYSVDRIQLSTEICTDRAKPMAVAGSVSRTRKGVDRRRCMPSIRVSPCSVR